MARQGKPLVVKATHICVCKARGERESVSEALSPRTKRRNGFPFSIREPIAKAGGDAVRENQSQEGEAEDQSTQGRSQQVMISASLAFLFYFIYLHAHFLPLISALGRYLVGRYLGTLDFEGSFPSLGLPVRSCPDASCCISVEFSQSCSYFRSVLYFVVFGKII